MAHTRVGLGLATVATGAYCASVYNSRRLPPVRLRKFSPGSADEQLSEILQTGDVLFFRRDPYTHYPLGLIPILLTSFKEGSEAFDHVAVVISHSGMPYVLEMTDIGPKIRSYSRRIVCSKSQEIVVLRQKRMRNPSKDRAAIKALEERLNPTNDDYQENEPVLALVKNALVAIPAACQNIFASLAGRPPRSLQFAQEVLEQLVPDVQQDSNTVETFRENLVGSGQFSESVVRME